MVICLSAILATLPLPAMTSQEFDALCINVVCDHQGAETLRQVGGLDFISYAGRPADYHWQWWRMIRVVGGPPYKVRGKYRLRWYDAQTRRSQQVESYLLFERWTVYDDEIEDRLEWPVINRRGLPGRDNEKSLAE